MDRKLLNLITHPAFISLILWGIIIYFIQPLFPKYSLKKTNELPVLKYTDHYSDLDSDGESEIVRIQVNDSLQTEIIISKGNKTVEQYNVFNTSQAGEFFFTNDYDSDGYKECYFFTMNTDSIFLTVFDPMKRKSYLIRNRFVDIRGRSRQSINAPNVDFLTMIDNEQSGKKDIVFSIRTGFSKYPRNVYRYFIDSDSLIRSPESGACISRGYAMDINDDSSPEIILDVQAPGNYDFDKPYTDQYVWLMILNKNMDFLFPPLRFLKYPAQLNTVPLYEEGKKRLVVFLNYTGTDSLRSAFLKMDSNGSILAKSFPDGFLNYQSLIIPNTSNNFNSFFLLRDLNGKVEEIDYKFSLVRQIDFPQRQYNNPVAKIDADNDGRDEYVFQGRGSGSIIITGNDFKNSTSFDVKEDFSICTVSQVLVKGEKPQIYLQSKDIGIILRYARNPMFYLKYPFYITMYGAVLVFILLMFRIQRFRIQAREKTGKQMALLQMKAIKNQLDPHFTLNVLNSIGSLYATEENREKADYIFGKYARLIRETVISADQVIITLGEEIEFIRNYLDIEIFRYKDAFSYTIIIEQSVDLEKKIPRMLIHTFVENSVKHGLKNSKGDGKLRISIQQLNKAYHIEIEDNNSEKAGTTTISSGTGKGLVIVSELTDLFFKLEKIQIKYQLEDLHLIEKAGKLARIEIPL